MNKWGLNGWIIRAGGMSEGSSSTRLKPLGRRSVIVVVVVCGTRI